MYVLCEAETIDRTAPISGSRNASEGQISRDISSLWKLTRVVFSITVRQRVEWSFRMPPSRTGFMKYESFFMDSIVRLWYYIYFEI